MKEHLKATLNVIYLDACNRYDKGEVKEFIGPRGYIVLLQDKLERLLKGATLQSDELVEAAVDAALALHFTAIAGVALRVVDDSPDEDAYEEADDDDS
jgi:hypothetical protein